MRLFQRVGNVYIVTVSLSQFWRLGKHEIWVLVGSASVEAYGLLPGWCLAGILPENNGRQGQWNPLEMLSMPVSPRHLWDFTS